VKKTKLSTIESKQKEICVVFGSEASSDKENSEEEDDGDESYDDDEEPYYDSDEDKEKLLNYLQYSATELDEIIRNIVHTTEGDDILNED
jgi:hypothetical protein